MNRNEVIVVNIENAPNAPEEYRGEYTVKRWTWYEKQQASSYATKVIDAARGIANWNVADWYTAMIKTCVTPPDKLIKKLAETEEDWNEHTIQNMDPDVGDILRDKCVDLTGVDKKGFLERSDTEKDTPT